MAIKYKFSSAAMVVIGNELLSGRTREGNGHLAAQRLFEQGCVLREVAIIPDNHAVIVATVRRLRQVADAVITSGGIGPTHDDITMEAIAAALDVALLEHGDTVQLMRDHYGADLLNDGRRRMARLPAGATPILCSKSIAPGAALDGVFVLAGVPAIFASQLEAILPQFGGDPIIRCEVPFHCFESSFYRQLGAIQQKFPQLEIGSYPKLCAGDPHGAIAISGRDAQLLERAKMAVNMMLREL
ncbi:MAG: molybdopterin-binding protein [Mariprofundales bacterium]|nr:molybdopterin-binding protein [Mariprofundales bacterium]